MANELLPELESYVDECYREFLKTQGRVGELINVDVVGAIDMMAQKGQWEQALNTSKQQNVSFNFTKILIFQHRPLLDKYLVMYVTELMNSDEYLLAAKQFLKYGTSSNSQNFNIYKKIIDRVCFLNVFI